MVSPEFERLALFLRKQMRMAHIYQPLMLRTLLVKRGQATRRDIATAFLAHDESQVEYYEHITAVMPGRVLTKHGVIRREGQSYQLASDYRPTRNAEIEELVALCDKAVEDFKVKRGNTIWDHRAAGWDRPPGAARYAVLKRAGFRCELCGLSADERALDVDHIIPRKHGGTNDEANLQVLCWKCNGDKGAGDSCVRKVRASYATREAGCAFRNNGAERAITEDYLTLPVPDCSPVVPRNTLLVPRRHVSDCFELYTPEHHALQRLLSGMRAQIWAEDSSVTGFNVGVNSGADAGQTGERCHVHLIPQRLGDVLDPWARARHTIPCEGHW